MSMTSSEEQNDADPGTRADSVAPAGQGSAEVPAATAAALTKADGTQADGGAGDNREGGKELGFLQLVGSALAAALGVQSSKNRERDFKQGRAGTFILVGIVFTALFIGAVYGVVSLVLSSR